MSNEIKWSDVRKEIFTPEENLITDFRVQLIGELINGRREKHFSQYQLSELTGVPQPVISRIETCTNIPDIRTILKLLAPLGKTLTIVPMNEDERKDDIHG